MTMIENSMTHGLHGVVLAGGKSSRMGRDKASLLFHGQELIRHAVNVLEPLCEKVWISGRDAREHGLSIPWFLDDASGKGPLVGILTALERIQAPCLVMPCDLPLMDASTLGRLITAYENRTAQTLRTNFVQEENGFAEALLAIYDTGCIPYIQKALNKGLYHAGRAVPQEYCLQLAYPRSASRPFLNVNTPQELALLEQAHGEFCLLPQKKKARFRQ